MDKWEYLLNHQGHKIVVAKYEDRGEVLNVSIECEDCWEVLQDYEVEKEGVK